MELKYTLDKKSIGILDNIPKEFHEAALHGVRKAMIYAEGQAKRVGFSGRPHLISRSGRLRNSIVSGVKEFGDTIVGSLSSDVIYAPTHEFGADIYPKKGRYLKFKIGEAWKSVKKVIIPARPFLKPALENNQVIINDIILDTIYREVNK